jgi:mannose-6-phosphate isomerase-like protein (cupin superfamily)
MNVDEILKKMAHSFQNKIDKDFMLTVVIKVDESSWHITTENETVTVSKSSHPHPHVTLRTTSDTLQRIYRGEMTAFTAAGKANISDPAPLDWKIPEDLDITPEIQANIYFFIQHFFNMTTPEKIVLKEQYSRVVHGGHVIPLYYYPGFRSGWYLVKKGEKINEPNDTNPFPQAFVIIEGEGMAKIGDDTVPVKAGESYYIPPESDHIIWTEQESLVLIWLAWGKGA